MRRIVLLAAMLIAPGLSALPAEAGERGPGFRHFSPPIGAAPHVWRGGKWFHPGHFRHVSPRHFGHQRAFRPRHFAHPGAFVRFRDDSFGFRFRTVPHFKPQHFVPHHFVWPHHFPRPQHFSRHHHRPPALTFARPSHFKSWGFSRAHQRSWGGRSHRRW